MLASPLPPSFLGTYNLPVSSLGCKALSIVIKFLVLRSICLSSSLVLFKNGPEYLTRRTAQVFIPLRKFLEQSLVSRSFLDRLRNSIRFFFSSFISACLVVPTSQVLVIFLFPKRSDSFLICQFYSTRYLSFSTFHYEYGTFFMPNSIPISWLYILIICIRVSNSFSFFPNSLMSSKYIKVINIFLWFNEFVVPRELLK